MGVAGKQPTGMLSYYHPPKKLWKSNVFTGVCLFTGGWVCFQWYHQVSLAVEWVCFQWWPPGVTNTGDGRYVQRGRVGGGMSRGWGVCPGVGEYVQGEYVQRRGGYVQRRVGCTRDLGYPPNQYWHLMAATKAHKIGKWAVHILLHPTGTLVNLVKCNKPVNSASHYEQWGHFFLACGDTNSVENPGISQSSLDLFEK